MSKSAAIPVIFVAEGALEAGQLTARQRAWAEANGFSGQRGKLLALPGEDDALSGYLFGTGAPDARPAFVAGLAAAALPAAEYRLEGDIGDATLAAIAFRLGAYRFDRYREAKPTPTLVLPEGTLLLPLSLATSSIPRRATSVPIICKRKSNASPPSAA
jgi:leucyl aminopeptidase